MLVLPRPGRFDARPCLSKLKMPSLVFLPSSFHDAQQTTDGTKQRLFFSHSPKGVRASFCFSLFPMQLAEYC